MKISQLIADLQEIVSETRDPDAEVWFDRNDKNNVRALPNSDSDTWTIRGLEYVGGPPCFEDGVVFLHA